MEKITTQNTKMASMVLYIYIIREKEKKFVLLLLFQ